MNKKERWEFFLNIIFDRETISKKELSSLAFKEGINTMTFWRDYKDLINRKYIYEDYGIVKLVKNIEGEAEKGRFIKSQINTSQKIKIAKYASTLIQENSVLFIATGTTLEQLVKKISTPIKCLYTNGAEILKLASENPFVENIVMLGGFYNSRSHGTYGDAALTQVEDVSFDQIFTSATAMDKNLKIYNNTFGESVLLSKVIKKDSKKYLLIDESKFNIIGVSQFADSSDFDLIITNISEKDIPVIENIKVI